MELEWVRMSRGVYGQTELVGASWDPLVLFAAAGLAFVVIHALYKALAKRKLTAAEKK